MMYISRIVTEVPCQAAAGVSHRTLLLRHFIPTYDKDYGVSAASGKGWGMGREGRVFPVHR